MVQKIQGGSSPTMISEWGVTKPPPCNRVVQKLQDGSTPTMISEWGVTPPPPSATGWFKNNKKGVFSATAAGKKNSFRLLGHVDQKVWHASNFRMTAEEKSRPSVLCSPLFPVLTNPPKSTFTPPHPPPPLPPPPPPPPPGLFPPLHQKRRSVFEEKEGGTRRGGMVSLHRDVVRKAILPTKKIKLFSSSVLPPDVALCICFATLPSPFRPQILAEIIGIIHETTKAWWGLSYI